MHEDTGKSFQEADSQEKSHRFDPLHTALKKRLFPSIRRLSLGYLVQALDEVVESIRKNELQVLVKDLERSQQSLVPVSTMVPHQFLDIVI